MKTISAFAATLCVASFSVDMALAQSAPHSTDAPIASTLTYASPLAGFVPLKEPVVSPASTWREVNRAVGSYDSMSATMGDMPGMAMPAGHDMKSMPMDHDMKSMPMKHDMKSMPMDHDMKSMPKKHDMKSMPMKHDMKSMPMDHDMKSMPKKHDMKSMPMDHDMKSMPMTQDKKPMPKTHEMKSMPMDHDMKMPMDAMPGMKMEGK